MLQFDVQSLLDREGKTRYWLVKQMEALDCEVQDLFTEE